MHDINALICFIVMVMINGNNFRSPLLDMHSTVNILYCRYLYLVQYNSYVHWVQPSVSDHGNPAAVIVAEMAMMPMILLHQTSQDHFISPYEGLGKVWW